MNKQTSRPEISKKNIELIREFSGVKYGSLDQALTELFKKIKGDSKC